jgi:hypothetical protein
MSFASDMQTVADDLLTELGQELTFTRVVAGNFNPATGSTGAGTTTTYTAKCHPSQYQAQDIDGILILRDDVRVIAYCATVPLVGDYVTIDGVSHGVRNVQRIKAQGTDVVYILQARI